MSAADKERRLRELMDALQQPLLRYAVRLAGGDTGFAEDVVQEAFLRAWVHAEQLTSDRGSVLGWMHRVVHNLIVDGYRRRANRPPEVDIDLAVAVAIPDPMTKVVDSLLVTQALEGLWPQHRAALEEVYLHDRTPAEVGEELDVPAGTIRSRLHYATRAARTALTESAAVAAPSVPATGHSAKPRHPSGPGRPKRSMPLIPAPA